MIKRSLFTVVVTTLALFLVGCKKSEEGTKVIKGVQTITAEEAKEMIDQNKDVIILDVRTKEEFQEGHIENAILIPYTNLAYEAEYEFDDMETPILIYCRSGRRSAIAATLLYELGYQNVYDFGGIIDWPYETIK